MKLNVLTHGCRWAGTKKKTTKKNFRGIITLVVASFLPSFLLSLALVGVVQLMAIALLHFGFPSCPEPHDVDFSKNSNVPKNQTTKELVSTETRTPGACVDERFFGSDAEESTHTSRKMFLLVPSQRACLCVCVCVPRREGGREGGREGFGKSNRRVILPMLHPARGIGRTKNSAGKHIP